VLGKVLLAAWYYSFKKIRFWELLEAFPLSPTFILAIILSHPSVV
jgi:hypothetical protein